MADTTPLAPSSERSASMAEASAQQIELLQHTLGVDDERRVPYRNHFVAGPGHHEMHHLIALEGLGLVARTRTPAFCDSGDIVFCATEAGRTLAIARLPPIPARSRYDEFLREDGGRTFGEHLCGVRLPRFEVRGQSWNRTVQYRMYREAYDACDRVLYREVSGEWAPTKKAAKASYKEALKGRANAEHVGKCNGDSCDFGWPNSQNNRN